MKLVILGAGASFDCIHNFHNEEDEKHPARPPLANGLFKERFRPVLEKYKGAESFSSELNFVRDIEQKFQEKYKHIENVRDDSMLARLIDVQFYLQELMGTISYEYEKVGANNYTKLVEDALQYANTKREDVCFVTFNYDSLLENAIKRIAHHNINSIKKYIEGSRIKVIKPHGSFNWGRKINNFKFKNTVDGDIAFSIYNDGIKYIDLVRQLADNIEVLPYWNSRTMGNTPIDPEFEGYFPQLLIPVKHKADFILPSSHYQYLLGTLPKVTEVLIIGWKGAELKFRELIKSTIGNRNINITVVDPSNVSTQFKPDFSFFGTASFSFFEQQWGYQAGLISKWND